MSRHFAWFAVVLLSTTGLAGCARANSGASATPVGSSSAAGADAASVLYVTPAAIATQDGTLYTHSVGTPAESDSLVAQGTDATFVSSSGAGAAAHLQWFDSGSHSVSFAAFPASEPVDVVANTDSPLTSLVLAGVNYMQVGEEVVASSAGKLLASYPLPTLQPDATVGGFPPGYKGVYTGVSVGTVSALVPTAGGDVLAFTSTGLASSVTDLMTGKNVPVPGYGTFGGAVRTPSGDIAVLAWRGYQAKYNFHVILLDGNTLGVQSSLDTGLAPAGYLRDRMLSVAGHDAVLSIAQGDEVSGVTLSVFSIDAGRATPLPSLPTGVGVEIAPGPTGSVYVFGGPAMNTVSELDLGTGALTKDLPSLRSPSGTFVVGIAG